MAFETNLIALSWEAGRYAVVSQTIAPVDTPAMERDKLFHDCSEDVGYFDEAAILHKSTLRKYLTSDSHNAALSWLQDLPKETMFILVHRAEWESGLGD